MTSSYDQINSNSPHGSVILDLANPSKLKDFKPEFTTVCDNFIIKHESTFDPVENMVNEKRTYINNDGTIQNGEIHMRFYSPLEINSLGNRYGLEMKSLLSKDGSQYKPESGRYWIELEKK